MNDNEQVTKEIDLENNSVRLLPGSYLLLTDYTARKTGFLYNAGEHFIYRLAGDSVLPDMNTRQFTRGDISYNMFKTDAYYVLTDADGYIFVNINDTAKGIVSSFFHPKVSSAFSFVQFSHAPPLLVSIDSLAVIGSLSVLSKQPVAGAGTLPNKASRSDYIYAYLSVDEKKIYCMSAANDINSIISLYPSPHFPDLNTARRGINKLRTLDLFETGNGLANIDNVTKDYAYWRNYYEKPE